MPGVLQPAAAAVEAAEAEAAVAAAVPEPAAAGLDRNPAAAARRVLAAGQLPAPPGHSRPSAWCVVGVGMGSGGMFWP